MRNPSRIAQLPHKGKDIDDYSRFYLLFLFMVFKWLFVFFAFWWLYHVLRPWLQPRRPPGPPPPGKADLGKNKLDGQGEYIDYEEVE